MPRIVVFEFIFKLLLHTLGIVTHFFAMYTQKCVTVTLLIICILAVYVT